MPAGREALGSAIPLLAHLWIDNLTSISHLNHIGQIILKTSQFVINQKFNNSRFDAIKNQPIHGHVHKKTIFPGIIMKFFIRMKIRVVTFSGMNRVMEFDSVLGRQSRGGAQCKRSDFKMEKTEASPGKP